MAFGLFELKAIGLGVLLPGLIAFVILAAMGRAARLWEPLASLAVPLALAASFYAAGLSLELFPIRPDKVGPQWIPILTLLAIPAGWLSARGRWRELILFALASTAFAAAVPIIPGYIAIRAGHSLWVFILGQCSLVLGVGLWRAAAEFPPAVFVAMLSVCGFFQAAILMDSGSASLAQISGFLAAALTGLAIYCRWISRDPKPIMARGAIPTFTAVSTGLIANNYFDSVSDNSQAYNWIGLLAPLGLAAVLLPPMRSLSGRRRALPAIALTIGLLLLAAILAHRSASL